MTLGTHLASLNLFREADGTVEITVSGHSPALMTEFAKTDNYGAPIDYAEDLIVTAAWRMDDRHTGRNRAKIIADKISEIMGSRMGSGDYDEITEFIRNL